MNLNKIYYAALPFWSRRGGLDETYGWAFELPGSPDLPEEIQNNLDRLTVLAGGFPESAFSKSTPAIGRIWHNMGLLLNRIVTTWALTENLNLEELSVGFAWSVDRNSLIQYATYDGQDISAKLKKSMITLLPTDRPIVFMKADPLSDDEINEIVKVLASFQPDEGDEEEDDS